MPLSFAQDLRLILSELLPRISGLKALVITDSDGVVVIKVMDDDAEDAAVESVITPSFLVTATAAAEQVRLQ
jgi:predicted regulator of Ras-like GTPase activity (Roadblock/LC7/MglB family)